MQYPRALVLKSNNWSVLLINGHVKGCMELECFVWVLETDD